MSNSFLAEFDELAVDSFRDVGLADIAQYRAGATVIPCTVMVDRTSQGFGDGETVVVSLLVTVTLFKADGIPRPLKGHKISIVDGGETFTVDEIQNEDESRYVVIVKPGA